MCSARGRSLRFGLVVSAAGCTLTLEAAERREAGGEKKEAIWSKQRIRQEGEGEVAAWRRAAVE